MALITLLTDFGTADGYVAEMKGVLLSAVTDARVIDLSHDIPPQDVERARLAVERYWRRFPIGTVHLVIVDPGVGSDRAALAVESDHRYLVGPDNGVLSAALVVPGSRAFRLPVPPGASATFHGRDLFAPAAAALSVGTPIEQIGAVHPSPIVRRTPEPRDVEGGAVEGEVVSIDRFGNLITNIPGPSEGAMLTVGDRRLTVCRTYADAPPGCVLALTGSSGCLEIAVREGNAAEMLGVSRGTVVRIRPRR